MRRFVLLGLLLVAAVFMMSNSLVVAQEGGDENPLQVEVIAGPQVAFPVVSLQVRVLDNGRSVSGLTAEAFSVDDSVEPDSFVVTSEAQTTSLAVVIDAPQVAGNSELERTLNVARQFFEDPANYEDGISVVLVVVRNNAFEFNVYDNRAAILGRINSIDSGIGQQNPINDALQVAASQLQQLTGESGSGNILLVSPFYWNATFIRNVPETAARIFTENGFPVNVVQAFTGGGSGRTNATDDYRAIAEAGGGEFAIWGPGETPEVLNPVYTAMRGTQASYTLYYRTEDGTPGERTVTVSANLASGTATGQFTYEGPDAAPPSVSFFDPQDGAVIERTSPVPGAAFDINEIDLTLTIADVQAGNSIESGRIDILVDGEVQESLSIPAEQLNPGQVAVSWGLGEFGFVEGGETVSREVELRAVLTDAFNREVVASQAVTVVTQLAGAVAAGGDAGDTTEAPAVTTDVTPTVTQTATTQAATSSEATITDAAGTVATVAVPDADATVAAAQTQVALAQTPPTGIDTTITDDTPPGGGLAADFGTNPDEIEANAQATIAAANAAVEAAREEAEDDRSDNTLLLVAGAVASAIFILSSVGFILLRRRSRRRVSSMDTMLGGYNMDPAAGSMKTMIGGASRQAEGPLAVLEVLSGNQSGREIPVDQPQFTIGREMAEGIDFATPSYDNVSSRHCTISKSGNGFAIEDHGSTNGTYLNGNKIAPHSPTNLPPQATIQLGHDSMSSIRLRFKPKQGASGGMPMAGKTRVDMGAGSASPGMPVDNAVWNKKTQMYGQPGESQNAAPQQGGQQQGGPQQASPGQFFNPSGQQPPPPQQPQQSPPNYRQQGNLESWNDLPEDDDDSWLDD